MGNEGLTGTEFQSGKTRSSRGGGWRWLHDKVNVLQATDLHTFKMVKRVNCMLYILSQ